MPPHLFRQRRHDARPIRECWKRREPYLARCWGNPSSLHRRDARPARPSNGPAAGGRT